MPSERAQKCRRLVLMLGAYGLVGAWESNFKDGQAKNGGINILFLLSSILSIH